MELYTKGAFFDPQLWNKKMVGTDMLATNSGLSEY